MNKDFWQGRRVLLTGHTGFKGAWLSLWLQQLGADVTGYALLPPTSPNLFELAKIERGMRSLIGDIRDYHAVFDVMRKAKPEIVIHMAAQPLVRYSYQQPVETYATNVMGTVHVLEAVRQTDTVRTVINITSDKCYENKELHRGYRENDPMGGFDPYSSSKGCAELVTAAYRSSYFHPEKYQEHGVAVATARAGNVIGGGDCSKDRLIPDIIKAYQNRKPVRIRNLQAVRPWQYVLDPLSGYLVLAEKLSTDGNQYAEAWNFGPNAEDAKTVQWITERLSEQLTDNRWSFEYSERLYETQILKLDSTKAYERLGWKSRCSLDDALKKIVEWHRFNNFGEDMNQISIRHIEWYEQMSIQI